MDGRDSLKRFRTSDGIDLAYCVDDYTDPWVDAPVLILLHAANGRLQRFYGMVPALARHFRTVRLDMRGHGASAVPDTDSPLTMDRLVADVAELMDVLGCGAAHLLGNSAGGYVAQHTAMTHPDRVLSLCLFGSTSGLKNTKRASDAKKMAKGSAQQVFAATVDYHFDAAVTDQRLIDWFVDEAGVNDSAFVARFVALMGSLEWSDQLHRITCPTLVVIPGAEVESGKRSYASLLENIPRVESLTYDGARHNICDAFPDRCARDALAFLMRSSA